MRFLSLYLAFAATCSAVVLFTYPVQGTYQLPDGTPFTGTLLLSLQAGSTPQNVCADPIIPVLSGTSTQKIIGGVLTPPTILSNSCLKPRIPYQISVIDANGAWVANTTWSEPILLPCLVGGVFAVDVSCAESTTGVPMALFVPLINLITSTSGTSVILFGQANKQIHIYSAFFQLQQDAAPANFGLVSGTGSNCGTRQEELLAPRPGVAGIGQSYTQLFYFGSKQYLLTAPIAADVCLNLTAAPISALVHLRYAIY